MAAKAGWSHSLTDFADQAGEDITQMARVIGIAMLTEVVNRSPVGNPDLWKANIALKSKNVALADAYDANVDVRNASNTGRKKFKKLTQRERKENFFVDAKAAGKGYIGGTFRGSHMVSIGAPDLTVVENVDPSGRETINKGAMLIRASGQFPVIYIQTNSPYGEMLELGHSTQAPGGVYDLAFIGVSEAYK
ncbi:HK97 gp10 family phage protein [Pseudomonas sp. MF7451]|uniref:HK97 gp10 family phage protein n=1 Tax=Pseudomonas sp. MF7451 TaxID=2797538 RepID=UPI0018E6E67B|nr:HK97 gp10 family phage protein [Pseudomonas sp. MF7451]MBJ2224913.1 HK97 gp10 family phage protein [Pseudomonas sp. MF7451]